MPHCPVIQALVVAANRRVAAAAACTRKYFVVASTVRGWAWRAIRGRMASVLSSRPIHAVSQCELVIVMLVPRSRVIKSRGIIKGFISKGRIVNQHCRGMGPIASLAYFTRKWCRGSTKSFDLFRLGSNPFFLRGRGDFNPHSSLYQSGPWVQAQHRGGGAYCGFILGVL